MVSAVEDFVVFYNLDRVWHLDRSEESALKTFEGPEGAQHLKRIMLKFSDDEDLQPGLKKWGLL